jgi:hypothetical protein
MCTELHLYYACGCVHSKNKTHTICTYGHFIRNFSGLFPTGIPSQELKNNENLCTASHKVFISQFRIYCSTCTAEEDAVTIKVEEEG